MRKIILLIIILLTTLSGVALLFIGFAHESIGKKLSDAAALIRAKDDFAAQNILNAVILKDSENEDAFIMLAQIAEREKNYLRAAAYWDRLTALNPLNADYLKNLFENILIARSDSYLAERFNSVNKSKKLSERIEYNAAMAMYSIGSADKFYDIFNSLKARRSPFADLIEAHLALLNLNFKSAEKKFFDLKKSSPRLSDYANYGLALCAISAKRTLEAKNFIESIKGDAPELQSEILLLKSGIAISENDFKTALSLMHQAAQIQSSNTDLLLECSELAFVVSDANVLEALQDSISVSGKESLELEYYLKSFAEALKGNFKKAEDNLSLSGSFANRHAARILAFKLACKLNQPQKLFAAFERLPTDMSEKLKNACAADLRSMIVKNKKNQELVVKLSSSLLKFAPSQEYPLRVSLAAAMENGDFDSALDYSEKLLEKFPDDPQAAESRAIALLNKGMAKEGFLLASSFAEKSDASAFWLVFASRFAAMLNDSQNVSKYAFIAVQRHSLSPEILFAAGMDVIKHSPIETAKNFITLLNSKTDSKCNYVAKLLEAELALNQKNPLAAKNFYSQALALNPESERAYVALAIVSYMLDDKKSAISTLEKGFLKIPNSAVIRLRLASLLIEKKNQSDVLRAREILEKLIKENPSNAMAYALLSQALAQLGKPYEAFEAAQSGAKLAPSNAEVIMQLGLRLAESGRHAESLEALLSAAEISKSPLLLEPLEKELLCVAAQENSALLKKSLAQAVLKTFPNSTKAKKLFDDAKFKIENKN